MRLLLWVLIVAVVALLGNTASPQTAKSDLSETSESMLTKPTVDRARAQSQVSPILGSLRYLRRDGRPDANDEEGDRSAILNDKIEEERGIVDGIFKLAEKVVGKPTVYTWRVKLKDNWFRLLRAGGVSPTELEAKAMRMTDPLKKANALVVARAYRVYYVDKANAGIFKGLYNSGLGPRYFFNAVKKQTTVDEQKIFLAMAKRYREWVVKNNLKYY